MNIADWLPTPFWEGPPLPRFLGIVWPWLQSGGQPFNLPMLPAAKKYISSIEEAATPQARLPTTTYSNIEEIEFPNGFDPDTFMPKKIRIKRKTETR